MTAFADDTIIAVTAAVATTGVIPYGSSIFGLFTVESGAVVSLTWHASADGVHYQPAQDDDGAIVQTVAASKAYQIPDALSGARFLKAVGDTTGTLRFSVKG